MKQDVLTRDFAQKRSKQISDIHYDVKLSFKPKTEKYNGICKIKFSSKSENIVLDFIGDVKKVLVNGKELKYKKTKYSLEIKAIKGNNIVEIHYENEYDHTGSGLHQFIDPEDGNEYIYSNFEPYSAHRMFPCFDQPDLKATYKLTVEAPKNWVVISNTYEENHEEINDNKITIFKKTPKFSTYLFHLSAGPYKCFYSDYKDMRLRIFCRQAFVKWMRSDEIFEITKQGLEFYSKYFNYPYPYEKYDQIFVPEFNHGAMENVGAVTFTEGLIYRHTPTWTERSRLANVILHEMVHMWFGNLVTMKWWDDLWLNESFADFLSYIGMINATKFKDGWEIFYARKAWAYYQDQLITTHPIRADATDTNIAFANFDGISYAKGAAVLKQLMFYIGEESFRKGIQKYFKKFEWSNTELNDFRLCLEEVYGQSLDKWFHIWFDTTGVNKIETKISSNIITLKQTSENKILRPHKIKIALINGNVQVLDVNIEDEYTEVKITSEPKLILPNYEDYGYMKVLLDKKSIDYSLNNMNNIEDNLTRQMVYGSLWQMVRDADFDPKKYLDLILKNSPEEKTLLLLERMFLKVSAILTYYIDDENYYKYCEKFYNLGWEHMEKNIPKENKNAWFSLILSVSQGSSSIKRLVDMIKGDYKIKDFEFNQDYRWDILSCLAARGYKEINKLLKEEMKKDPSDKGIKSASRVESSKIENKEKFWKMFLEGKESLDYIRSAMSGFYWRIQKEKLKPYIDKFFDSIIKIFQEKDRYYSSDFFEILYPHIIVEKEVKEKTENFLKNNPKVPLLLKKNMLESIDEMERALKILEKFPN